MYLLKGHYDKVKNVPVFFFYFGHFKYASYYPFNYSGRKNPQNIGECLLCCI